MEEPAAELAGEPTPTVEAADDEAAVEAAVEAPPQPPVPAYERGQLVWSKIYGFPWWPAQVFAQQRIR